MGAYRYCMRCDAGMGLPTLVDVVRGTQPCPNASCHYAAELGQWEREEVARDIQEKLDFLMTLADEVGRKPNENAH